MYDVTRLESTTNLLKWLAEFIRQADIADPDTFPFILVGNKTDLPNRVVTKRQAQELAVKLRKMCTDKADQWRGTLLDSVVPEERHGLTRRRSVASVSDGGLVMRTGRTRRLFGVPRITMSGSSPPSPAAAQFPPLPEPLFTPKGSASSVRLGTKDTHWRDSIASRYSVYETASEFSEEYDTAQSDDDAEWESSQAPSISFSYARSSDESSDTSSTSSSFSQTDTQRPPSSPASVPLTRVSTDSKPSNNSLPLFEVSAKTGTRVDEIFAYIAANVRSPRYDFDILAGEDEMEEESERKRIISIFGTARKEGSSCAC